MQSFPQTQTLVSSLWMYRTELHCEHEDSNSDVWSPVWSSWSVPHFHLNDWWLVTAVCRRVVCFRVNGTADDPEVLFNVLQNQIHGWKNVCSFCSFPRTLLQLTAIIGTVMSPLYFYKGFCLSSMSFCSWLSREMPRGNIVEKNKTVWIFISCRSLSLNMMEVSYIFVKC